VRVSIKTYYNNKKDIHIKVFEKDISPNAAVPDPSLLLFFSVCVMRAMGYDGKADLLASSIMGYDGKAASSTMGYDGKADLLASSTMGYDGKADLLASSTMGYDGKAASSTMGYDGKADPLASSKQSKEDIIDWKISQPIAGEETRLVGHYKKLGFESVKGREKDGVQYMEADIDVLIDKLKDLISKY
jgi:hypothetical protein